MTRFPFDVGAQFEIQIILEMYKAMQIKKIWSSMYINYANFHGEHYGNIAILCISTSKQPFTTTALRMVIPYAEELPSNIDKQVFKG